MAISVLVLATLVIAAPTTSPADAAIETAENQLAEGLFTDALATISNAQHEAVSVRDRTRLTYQRGRVLVALGRPVLAFVAFVELTRLGSDAWTSLAPAKPTTTHLRSCAARFVGDGRHDEDIEEFLKTSLGVPASPLEPALHRELEVDGSWRCPIAGIDVAPGVAVARSTWPWWGVGIASALAVSSGALAFVFQSNANQATDQLNAGTVVEPTAYMSLESDRRRNIDRAIVGYAGIGVSAAVAVIFAIVGSTD